MRRLLIRSGAAAALLALAGAAPATSPAGAAEARPSEAARPSVLLVTLDTTRADHLGCYGAAEAATPHLDALARRGTRFEHALSPTPLTLPSHVTLLTGLVPRHHRVRDNAGFRLGADVPVLAERLRAAGYATAAFVSAAVLDRGLGLSRGFDIYDDTVRIGERSAFNYEERAASQTIDAVFGRLTEIRSPFFLWVHLYDPHLPYVPPEPFRSRFKEAPYDGEIAFMDREIGRLLEKVEAKAGGALIVVAAGDHGESLGEHGETAHGVFVYEATQRIPLIIAGPGIPAGRVVTATVGLVDVAPTLLELLGRPPLAGVDGRSLVPLLDDGSVPGSDYELETFFPALSYGWSPLRAIVRGGRKYVAAPRPELYDLEADPHEKVNLYPTRPDPARELARRLDLLTSGDEVVPSDDPLLEEQRRRLSALGYVGGSSGDDAVDPKDGVLWLSDLESARRELQTGDPKSCIAPVERLLARNPGNVPALLVLGQCRLSAGDLPRAEAAFRRAIDLNPGHALSHFNLANALAAKAGGDDTAVAAARNAYERALAIDPRYAEAYLNYAAFLARHDGPASAEVLLARARQAGVRDPDIEIEIGVLALARGDVAEGRRALEQAVALNPRDARSLEALGRIAYREDRFAASADYYSRALEVAPSASLAKTLGSIRLYELGDREGARRAYQRAIALASPGDPDLANLTELVRDLAPR